MEKTGLAAQAREVDWDEIGDLVHDLISWRLKDDPKLGNAVTFTEGQEWARNLANRITYDIHRKLDPEYDA